MKAKRIFISTLAIVGMLTGCQGGKLEQTAARNATWQHFIGAMHEHSGYSDGAIGTTPADYFQAGKALGLDFVAGSEHSDNAHVPVTANTDCVSEQILDCIDLSAEGFFKWDASADIAAALSDASFTAIRGFEWTSDRYGHINVYFSQHDLNAKLGLGYALWMEPFWTWLGLEPDVLGGADGVVVFNHPGREDMLHTACDNLGPLAATCGTVFNGDPSYTWNDFEYRPELAERVVGIEMYGKSNHYYDGDNGAPPGGWYAYALDKGWRLGPVGAEDEHGQQWGQPSRAKTVILALDNNPEALKQAMLQRRFYALAHDYNHLRIEFEAIDVDGQAQVMGSQVSHAPGEQVELNFSVSGLDPAQTQIEFIGTGGQILAVERGASAGFSIGAISDRSEWVFARVRDLADADGDERLGEVVAVSAPIWFSAALGEPLN